jgi:hypothetical protein
MDRRSDRMEYRVEDLEESGWPAPWHYAGDSGFLRAFRRLAYAAASDLLYVYSTIFIANVWLGLSMKKINFLKRLTQTRFFSTQRSKFFFEWEKSIFLNAITFDCLVG